MASDVNIYTDPHCPYCRRLKQYLDQKGVAYRNHDVTTDPSAAVEVERLNAPGLPVTVIGPETVIGFNPDELAQALRENGVTARSGA